MKRECRPRVLEPYELLNDRLLFDEAYAEAELAAVKNRFAARFSTEFGKHWAGKTIVNLGHGYSGQIAIALSWVLTEAVIVGIEESEAKLHGMTRVEMPTLTGKCVIQVVSVPLSFLREWPLFEWLDLGDEVDHDPETFFGDAIVGDEFLRYSPDPSKSWQVLAGLGKAGVTAVLVGDLMRPASEAEAEAIVARVAQNAEPTAREHFRATLKAAFTLEEVRQQLRAEAPRGDQFRDFTLEPLDDHHWVAYGILAAPRW